MKKNIKFFILTAVFAPVCIGAADAAVCSRANLTRCLDSACAINIGSNPAARCQLCGTSSAGAASTENGMKQLSIGASAKNTISDKELKKAPSDPGARYVWATDECIKKIDGCTPDDVSDTYDNLIKQSCQAAGVDSALAGLQAAAKKTKSATTCESEINLCIAGEKRCGPGFTNCKSDSDFDKYFAACSVEAGGCSDHIGKIRENVLISRNSAINSQEKLVTTIIESYQNKRAKKAQANIDACTNSVAKQACIANICATNMKHKCAPEYAYEKEAAGLLCKHHDTACGRLK